MNELNISPRIFSYNIPPSTLRGVDRHEKWTACAILSRPGQRIASPRIRQPTTEHSLARRPKYRQTSAPWQQQCGTREASPADGLYPWDGLPARNYRKRCPSAVRFPPPCHREPIHTLGKRQLSFPCRNVFRQARQSIPCLPGRYSPIFARSRWPNWDRKTPCTTVFSAEGNCPISTPWHLGARRVSGDVSRRS